eukprot:CAMPEP_0175306590 /NCGR_PEP_ID=MMETSP0093-20121207/64324_1 /TAXON_ID=311494 /ORGANISM="Alexandrium monilatum, Strain CCMP3105" /LENGTH=67 /DNA_ID=CAMNT_0016603025 /DNA_START=66 /DNA_END=265 /DNA_ORIENTATION=+
MKSEPSSGSTGSVLKAGAGAGAPRPALVHLPLLASKCRPPCGGGRCWGKGGSAGKGGPTIMAPGAGS